MKNLLLGIFVLLAFGIVGRWDHEDALLIDELARARSEMQLECIEASRTSSSRPSISALALYGTRDRDGVARKFNCTVIRGQANARR